MKWQDFKIDDSIISIFAKGQSANIEEDEYEFIKNRTFVIGLNEFSRTPHMRFWNDVGIAYLYDRYYKNREKDCLLSTRMQTLVHEKLPIKQKIDVTWDTLEDELNRDKITLMSCLELITKYMSNKTVMLFGVDCDETKTERLTYDPVSDSFKIENRKGYGDYLNKTRKMLEIYSIGKPIINCNVDAPIDMQKMDWFEVLVR